MQGENNGEEENRVMKIGDTAAVFHCTFGALTEVHFLHFYIPFQSSESQESNDSNHVQFGAEMRKIGPSEDNCIKLRDNFARWKSRCEFLSSKCGIFAHLKPKCEIGTPTCENWIFFPTLFLLIFFVSKFPFSPCIQRLM